MRNRKLLVLAGLLTMLCAKSAAYAGSLTLPMGDVLTGTLTGGGLGTSAAPGEFGINVTNATGNPFIYYAGEILWSNAYDSKGYLGGGTGPNGTASFVTFCTQLYTDVYIGSTQSYTVSSLASVADVSNNTYSGQTATLVTDVITDAVRSGDLTGANANAAAAGVQLAIWKIIYDYKATTPALSLLPSTGTIGWDKTTDWGAYAAHYLADTANESFSTPDEVFGLKSSNGVQNQSILGAELRPLDSTSSTPLPKSSVACLALFGALGLGAGSRRLVASAR